MIVLKKNLTLIGCPQWALLSQLREMEEDPEEWARFKPESEIVHLSVGMIERDIKTLIGCPAADVLKAAGIAVTEVNLRRLAHVAILEANRVGKVAGQVMRRPADGAEQGSSSGSVAPSPQPPQPPQLPQPDSHPGLHQHEGSNTHSSPSQVAQATPAPEQLTLEVRHHLNFLCS